MRDLKIGDRVRAVTGTGALTYSPVYFFGHQDSGTVGSYLQISVEELAEPAAVLGKLPEASMQLPVKVLEMSPLHFLPVASRGEGCCLEWAQRRMRRARDLAVGDVVWAEGGGAGPRFQPHRCALLCSLASLEYGWCMTEMIPWH